MNDQTIALTSPLLKPLTIAGMTLRNRIVMAPMGTGLDEDGRMNDATVAYYRKRAAGGVGAVTVEALLVDPATRGPEPRIYSREYVPGLRRLVDEVHLEGAAVGAQLLHPGRQVLAGRRAGPSAIAINSSSPVPEPLSTAEIGDIVEMFANAASIVEECGFDFVEVHAAHGYLISDFLSPLANHRTDEYGGDEVRRTRFCREVARAIRDRCPTLPLIFRIGGEEALPDGIDIEQAIGLARALETDGVDCISVSAGNWKSLQVTIAPMWRPRGSLVHLAAKVGAAVGIPIMAVGRLDDPRDAERALDDGSADLIALGRGLIADADWVDKVAHHRITSIRPCIACNACVDRVGPGGEVRCAVNPAVGREHDWTVEPSEFRRRILVVGSGPAGLEASRIAAERGHEVVLVERDSRIGGKLFAAASAPSKHEVLLFRDWEEREIKRLGVDIRTNTTDLKGVVSVFDPHAVILATGASPLLPPIPGLSAGHVHDAQRILDGTLAIAPGAHVAVLGGSATGCEVAELLADTGAHVTIFEMATSIGRGIEAITRRHIVRELRRRGVIIQTGARVTAVTASHVEFECGGTTDSTPADTVAVALGWRSRAAESDSAIAGRDVYVVGDADVPADFVAAVRAGADAGRSV